MNRCSVVYSRTHCWPFLTGIDGLKCELDAGHDDPHMGRYSMAFAQEGGEDHLAEFRFTVVSEDP